MDTTPDVLQNSNLEGKIERKRDVILREQVEIDKRYEDAVFNHLHAAAF